MNRRELLKAMMLGGVIVAGELWVPGAKLISIPKRPLRNWAYPPGDIRHYWAVGDGVTDDYKAFQAAVDDPTPRSIGIYVPDGNWYVSRPATGVLSGFDIGMQFEGPKIEPRMIVS